VDRHAGTENDTLADLDAVTDVQTGGARVAAQANRRVRSRAACSPASTRTTRSPLCPSLRGVSPLAMQ
jgi:hypothetical protein